MDSARSQKGIERHGVADAKAFWIWNSQTCRHNCTTRFQKSLGFPAHPALILIDDGAILFRHENSRAAWPELKGVDGQQPFVILKMSAPLCRGDLWPHLKAQAKDRLLVVISADDLRGEDTEIRRLSWEQCAADAFATLQQDPVGQELLAAAHVIVNFGFAGALWVRQGGIHPRLVFDPKQIEGEFGNEVDGKVYGFQTCLATGIAQRCLLAMEKNLAPGAGIEAGIMAGCSPGAAWLKWGTV